MIVPRNIFEIAGLCESGHSKFALGSVQFGCADGRGFAYATSRKQLIAADWVGDPDPEEEMLVPRRQCASAAAADFWQFHDELILSPGKVSGFGGSTIAYKPTKGKFPPCREAFVEPQNSVDVRIDLRLLKELVDTMVAMVAMAKGTDPVCVTLSIDRNKPDKVLLTSSEEDPQSMGNVAGLLMCAEPKGCSPPTGPAWYPGMKAKEGGNAK